jgi:23S rRNA pseudouridine955/2504/2580 synthase
LVEVFIETGRMHQIRVHAQYVGHPLACDDKYGDREFDRKLHAQGLNQFINLSIRIIINHTAC